MKYFFYFIAIVLISAFQSVLFSELAVWHTVPDLLFLFSIYTAAKTQNYDFVFVALVGGLYADVASQLPVGSHMLGYLISSIVINSVFNSLITLQFDWKYVPAVSLIGTSALLFWLAGFSWLVQVITRMSISIDISTVLHYLIPTLVLTAVAMFPMYVINEFFHQWLSRLDLRKKGGSV